MCPFCVAALMALGAKTLAAGGAAGVAAKLALKHRGEAISFGITADVDEEHSTRPRLMPHDAT